MNLLLQNDEHSYGEIVLVRVMLHRHLFEVMFVKMMILVVMAVLYLSIHAACGLYLMTTTIVNDEALLPADEAAVFVGKDSIMALRSPFPFHQCATGWSCNSLLYVLQSIRLLPTRQFRIYNICKSLVSWWSSSFIKER